MRELTVHTAPEYRVLVGAGLTERLGSMLAERYPAVAVVSDDTVFALYGQAVMSSLRAAGKRAVSFVFPHGEASKTPETLLKIVGFLAGNQFTRTDLVVALGGGVVGDVAGFAASVYLRGIDCVQLPTTLLAMIDSSVGGKTAVDLPQGKNLMGTFSQPALVVCDTDALRTLPRGEVLNGVGEAIKYGAIADSRLFASLESGTVSDPAQLICRCLEIKKDAVERDTQDRGVRQMLNFGHTLAHGVESLSDYRVPHGQAVAIGMCRITRWAERRGLSPAGTAERLERACAAFGMQTDYPCDGRTLFRAALHDKKRRGDVLTLVLLREIGQYYLYDLDVSEEILF